MDRLTINRRIPPKGKLMVITEQERDKAKATNWADVYNRLAAYEDTGLTPEEITALIADNKRLHELVEILENTIKAL